MKPRVFSIILILCFLFILYPPRTEGSDDDIIVFRIAIAGDQYYQARNQNRQNSNETAIIRNDDWKNDLIDLIGCVNRKFEEQGIKVKFEIAEIVSWRTEEEIATINESLSDLIKKISLGDCDIVIGLTAKAFSENDKGGLCSSQKYILVRDYSLFVPKEDTMVRENKGSWTFAILLHEIGHFFLGITHSDNPGSIMHEAWPSGYKEDFLKEEVELINKNAPEIKKRK